MTVTRGGVIHAVRIGQVTGEREHHATSTCWCEPSPLLRDLASGAAIWVHGTSNTEPEPAAEEDGIFMTAGERHAAAVDAVARAMGFDR